MDEGMALVLAESARRASSWANVGNGYMVAFRYRLSIHFLKIFLRTQKSPVCKVCNI